MRILLTILLMPALYTGVSAQQGDTLNIPALQYRTWNEDVWTPLDSTLSTANHIDLNEWDRDIYGNLPMGNLATPLAQIVYRPDADIGPRNGFQSYFRNWSRPGDVRFYNVKAPVSELRYMSGYTKGQMFGGFITLNPSARSNLYFDYQRVSARGDYFSQDNLYDNIRASGIWRTADERYRVQAALVWHKNRGRENGGITNTTGFSDPDSLVSNRELINIRWNNASFKARLFEARVAQEFLPFADSGRSAGIGLYHDGSVFYSDREFMSTDTLLGYQYLGVITHDSTYSTGSDQQAGIILRSGISGFTFARAGIGYRFANLRSDYIRTGEDALYLTAELRGEARAFDWAARGRYHIGGSQIGGFDLNGNLTARLGNWQLRAEATFRNQHPDLQSELWMSNQYLWNRNWETTLYQSLAGELGYGQWLAFSVRVNNWNRMRFYDHQGMPDQITGPLQLVQSEMKALLPIASWLELRSRTTMQLANDPDDILRLPTWVSRTGIFGKWQLFSGALKAYTGVEGLYFSKHRANAYMPITGVFHLQDDMEIGDFPFVNAVAGFQIRSFELFIVYENAPEGLVSREYYAAPYYPMPDRTFRVGFKWRFFN